MKLQWEQLYLALQNEIKTAQEVTLPETEIAENCYRIACRYWELLKEKFKQRVMQIDEEEIEFFKEVKPKFTCYIEYFIILNQGLLFVPMEPTERINYWEEEMKRNQRFLERNSDFIQYYEEKRKEYDAVYFLRRKNRNGLLPQEKIYSDMECRSSHDNLVRSYLANRMYNEFVKEKIEIASLQSQ